ncbi:mannose-1-phosphate guanylyltransferase [Paenibacillus sp. BIHB 4019]|uniref:Mannose-1-phosphate guanylyltransferase n=1 Tax=Paenibacillus sp. BIHB 4019 TaxID=1870819 RepID=A0A1B2DI34_9BACL|nr:sugar phosphate nucleotidyltransferase [Paenibacillus sp. BIHB 4019]ANY67339.1 mannose-1-phosphate guanylyltransferase [Paenibacillus sp. BIHB 4019]
MKLILLSGGSGKRLWPLSNDARSKQFLRILDGPGGLKESMVERVWRQLGETGLQSSSYIAAGKAQEEMIRVHAGLSVPLIIEPERRDTFPAIALSAVYLYSVAGVSLDEVVTILPVDPYVEDAFFHKISELEQVIRDSGCDMALMGVKPTFPSEKYGYIVPETGEPKLIINAAGDVTEAEVNDAETGNARSYRLVRHFTEKPREDAASELMQRGALWNCGVFAFKLGYLINLLIEKRIPIQYDELVSQYSTLVKTSFDYEVVERAKQVAVLPFDGCWKDLGTWNTLTEEMGTSELGEHITTELATDTHVINELGIPITILGIKNAIVAASPDGILVSDKASSPRIKEVLKNSDKRPMYEERRWGYYIVLDYLKYPDGSEVMTKRVCLDRGKNFSYHYHNNRCEVWTILSGEGEMMLDDQLRTVKAGDIINIPLGSRHCLLALTPMEMIEVMRGTQLVEEESVRLEADWNDIMQYCMI